MFVACAGPSNIRPGKAITIVPLALEDAVKTFHPLHMDDVENGVIYFTKAVSQHQPGLLLGMQRDGIPTVSAFL